MVIVLYLFHFKAGVPGDDWQYFANKFRGGRLLENPADAVHRPTGIAEGANGEIYISSTVSGRVWKIIYSGNRVKHTLRK